MSTGVSPDEVIARLPGWQGAFWENLDGGRTSRVWRLEKDGRRAVLKIDAEARSVPFASRRAEAAVQAAAAAVGLAGPVLYAEERVLLAEYVDGCPWQPSALDEPANIEQLADSLRRLHALPKTGRSFDANAAARHYAQRIADPDPKLVSLSLRVVEDTVQSATPCCCHNDLVAENILTTPGLVFLDWEYACDNDPMFDLATLVSHHELGETQASALLDAYCEGDGSRWRPRLAAQTHVYLALHYLWLAVRAEPAASGLRQLGERLLTSYSEAL